MKHLLALILWIPLMAFAQTSVTVDIDEASLAWDWVVASDGALPSEFKVKCGNQSGNYTVTTSVPYPTLTAPVSSVISGVGEWFCVVTADNTTDDDGQNLILESPPSNEVRFFAGNALGAPANLRIQAQ